MNKKLFYILSLTWGLPMTICGALVALSLIVTGHRPKRFAWGWYFEIGRTSWGGLSLGPVMITQYGASDYLRSHEHGHALQNCVYGPFILPLVLYSVIRYHVRNALARRGRCLPGYYDQWFEAQASEWGQKFMKKIR